MNNYFYVGQTVYHPTMGKGTVMSVNCIILPVQVNFEQYGGIGIFTHDGRETEETNVVLSQNPIPPIVNKPIVRYERGDVIVPFYSDGSSPGIKIFSKYVGDQVACYATYQAYLEKDENMGRYNVYRHHELYAKKYEPNSSNT